MDPLFTERALRKAPTLIFGIQIGIRISSEGNPYREGNDREELCNPQQTKTAVLFIYSVRH